MPYDLVMLHVGGNDVVRFTSAKQFRADIREALAGAKAIGDHVLLTSTGNVGTVGLFPAPTRWIFGYRTRLLRDIMIEEVERAGENVRFTDLYEKRANDAFAQEPQVYYAPDYFHPSDAGYASWFVEIEKELDAMPLTESQNNRE